MVKLITPNGLYTLFRQSKLEIHHISQIHFFIKFQNPA
jgi:hypothetical protein